MSDEPRRKPFTDEDYQVRWDESFENIKQELRAVSQRLQELLPDPSLGPDERIERLARVIPNSLLVSANRLNARTKLHAIRRRLTELIPDDLAVGSVAKVEFLKARLDDLVPGELPTIVKLETLGDFRGADTGVSPRGWE